MTSIDLDAVERELAALRRLTFAPAMEARFEADSLPGRIQVGSVTLVLAVILFDLYLVTDWVVVPDVFAWMAIARLAVFTPVVLLALWCLRRARRDWQFDALIAAGTVLSVFLPTLVLVFSRTEHALAYQFGSLLPMMYMTVIQRVRVRFALAGILAALAVQFTATAFMPAIEADSYQSVVTFFLTASVLLLMASFLLERGERYSFLLRLRGDLLRAEIEANGRLDHLTGLFNRRHLSVVGATLADRGPYPIGALLLDIDHFKRFNDTQGHLEGDRCIRLVSDTIRIALRAACPNAAVFRFGGEEFLVLLPGATPAVTQALGEAVRHGIEALGLPHPGLGPAGLVTISVGTAVATRPHAGRLDALLAGADAALYEAKRLGRNRVCGAPASQEIRTQGIGAIAAAL